VNIIQRVLKRIAHGLERYQDDDFPSVVLLLREPEFPDPEALLRTAQESWGANGPVTLLGTLRQKRSYIFHCGKTAFSIHCETRPYGNGEGREPLEALQRPWDEHKAWLSVDFPYGKNRKLSAEGELGNVYKMLLIYAFKIWSSNALAIFFPGEHVTVPNFGELAESIQWGRRTGLDLKFLD
jgi:hypothetical protein